MDLLGLGQYWAGLLFWAGSFFGPHFFLNWTFFFLIYPLLAMGIDITTS